MKKFMPLVSASLVFVASISTAQAQNSTSAKDSDRLMNDARYISPNSSREDSNYPDKQMRQTREPSFEDFTGFYTGGDIGYNIGSHDVNNPAGADGDVGLDGFEGGVFAGYGFMHRFNWLGGYAGLEIGHEWSGADGDLDGIGYEKDHAWLVTLRPGITMYDDAMAYGIVGYTRAKFEGNGDKENLDGMIFGAGSEFSTGTPLKARIEYTYTNYEDTNLGGIDFEGQENQIKLGALLRF